jgi:glycosyltransferase involved in cell wall biosynthesis
MPVRPPLRVLQVVPQMSLALGGPLISALNLGAGLTDEGASVTFLTMACDLDQATRTRFHLHENQVRTMTGRENRFRLSRADRDLIDQVVAAADIIHAHGIWETLIYETVRAAQRHNRPVVISACGMLTSWSLAQKHLKKSLYLALRGKVLLGVDRLHATSEFEAAEIARRGVAPERIVQVPLALPPLPPSPALPSSGPVYTIGCLGRIAPGKGIELLLAAFAALTKLTADALELVLTGPVRLEYRCALTEQAQALGIAAQVRFNEPVSGFEVHARLAALDLFVLLSEHENFGLSIAEALAAGTPVVISPFTGLSALVQPGTVGAVCERDTAAAAAAMHGWYRRKRAEPELSARCTELALAHFSPGKINAGWIRVYEAVSRQSG